MLIEVGAGGRADGVFGRGLQRRRQGLLCPALFGLEGMTPIGEEICDRRICERFATGLGAVGHELPHSFRTAGGRCSLVDANRASKGAGRIADFERIEWPVQSPASLVTAVTDKACQWGPLSYR